MEAFMVWGLMAAPRTPDSEERDEINRAVKTVAQAYYIQSGFKQIVDEKADEYEDRFIKPLPEELKKTAGVIIFILKTYQDGKITYTWSF